MDWLLQSQIRDTLKENLMNQMAVVGLNRFGYLAHPALGVGYQNFLSPIAHEGLSPRIQYAA